MSIDRRMLLAGLSSLAAGPASTAPAEPWLAYEKRLRERIADGGGGLFQAAIETELRAETNAFRAQQAKKPLAADAELALAARAHAADMLARDFFDHASPDGFTAIDRTGLLARSFVGLMGENLAYFSTQSSRPWSAAQIVAGWQRSPPHRANLVGDFTHVGHGVVTSRGRWMAAAVYGGLSARLAKPAPLRISPDRIGEHLSKAEPPLYGFSIAEPQGEPRPEMWLLQGASPRLAVGAWRLRPLMSGSQRGGARVVAGSPVGVPTTNSYLVLWGPIFVVG